MATVLDGPFALLAAKSIGAFTCPLQDIHALTCLRIRYASILIRAATTPWGLMHLNSKALLAMYVAVQQSVVPAYNMAACAKALRFWIGQCDGGRCTLWGHNKWAGKLYATAAWVLELGARVEPAHHCV